MKEKAADEPTMTIGQVSTETGLSISTIRFYEREFGGYLRVHKTPGGHRRYRTEDLEKLRRIHRLAHEQGKPLKEVRETLVSELDPLLLRKDVDLLLDVFESLVQENVKLEAALKKMAERVTALEEEGRKTKKRFKLF